jgi:hypothetical protein
MIYTKSEAMAADIYTKCFTDKAKWEHACALINIGPKSQLKNMIRKARVRYKTGILGESEPQEVGNNEEEITSPGGNNENSKESNNHGNNKRPKKEEQEASNKEEKIQTYTEIDLDDTSDIEGGKDKNNSDRRKNNRRKNDNNTR